jgi:hypothetical protein
VQDFALSALMYASNCYASCTQDGESSVCTCVVFHLPFCVLQITVLNAKGIVIKPLSPAPAAAAASNNQQQQQQQLPSSFSGAHMEVGEQVLAAGLPLNPGGSVSLPVAVTVGKPPGDAFDAVMLQVRVAQLPY